MSQSDRIRLALACAILLCGLGFPTIHGSPAAYTETRSFRDALDGRSMEEAISGPVDKDTSSYGERTASSSMPNGSPRGMQAASMMLNIPANGNLMGSNEQQPQEEQQQQKSSNGGSDLERDTSPAPEDSLMDTEQKMLEPSLPIQTSLMEMNARQMQQQQQKMMLMMMMKNAGQEQQQEQESTTDSNEKSGGAKGQSEQGFGEDQSMGLAKGASKRPQDYTKSTSAADKQKYDRDEQQMQDQQQKQMRDFNGSQDEQQVVALNGKGGGGEMSAEQLAKQKMMAAMLMTMSKAMNYQSSMMPVAMQAAQASYGSSMDSGASLKGSMKRMNGGNMIMSTDNVKSMMNSAISGPMMMDAYKPGSQSANYKGYSTRRGGMRRANQRKLSTKKMSPAMVNTLLNKMMNSSSTPSYSAGLMGTLKPDAMAMLMKTAAGAELLTNMVAYKSPMASAVAREQYKRMMMAAIMKQATGARRGAESLNSYGGMGSDAMGSSYSAGSNRQEQLTASQRKQPLASAKSTSASRGFGSATGASAAPVLSPLAVMMNLMNAQKSMISPMAQLEQQEQQISMNEPPSYSSTFAKAAGSRRSKTSGGQAPQLMEQQLMMNTGNSQSGFGDDSTTTPTATKSSSANRAKTPNKLAMMMSNGAAAREANRYSSMKSPVNQMVVGDMAQQKYQSEQGMNELDQQQQQQTSLDMKTKGSMKDDEMATTPTMASVPRPTMPMASGNIMRPMMKPLASVKGSQQQEKDDFEQSQAPNSYLNGGSDNDSQQQMDRGQEGPLEQVKGRQQQVDENGAAPRGMAEPFAFDYKVEDDHGNEHYRKEESDKNGAVRGSYGYMDNNGLYRHVEYVADENGFRANVKSNEPGLSSDSPKLSPSAMSSGSGSGSGLTTGSSQQTARPAAMGSAQESGNSQMMSQMLDVAQMMAANEANQQQQQQQMPASQTELSAEESRRRRA